MPKVSLKEARQLAAKHDFASSVANYLGVLKFFPAKRSELESEFLQVLNNFCFQLVRKPHDGLKIANEYFSLAATLYPESSKMLNVWGDFLAQQNCWEQASICFLKAISLNPISASCCAEARLRLQNIKSQLVDQWHFRMLNDFTRNSAYRHSISHRIEQIKRAVGSEREVSVLDIGSGTGLLSLFAGSSGASSVVACEESEVMSAISSEILSKNGESERIIEIWRGNSGEYSKTDGRHFDLVITELFDAGFFGENIVGAILDALNRNLINETTVVIPSKAEIFIAAIEAPEIRRETFLNSFAEKLAGIVKVADKFASDECFGKNFGSDSEPYDSEFLSSLKSGYRFLSEPLSVDKIDFQDAEDLRDHFEGLKRDFELPFSVSGQVDALVSWFELELVPGIKLSSHPSKQSCWEQAIFPVSGLEIEAEVGNNLEFSVEIKENWFSCSVDSTTTNCTEVVRCLPSWKIATLNDALYLNCYRFFLQGLKRSLSDSESGAIIDISCEEVLGLMTGNFFPESEILSLREEATLSPDFVAKLCEENPEISSKLRFCSKSDVENSKEKCSALICQPIERCGLLKPDALEDIAFYRLQFGITAVIPSVIEVWAQIVQSDEILGLTKVVSDSCTGLDLHIKDIMNLFQTSVQQDVELSTLNYKALTEKFKLLTLNLAEDLTTNSEEMPLFLKQNVGMNQSIVRDGRMDACLVWYELSHQFSEVRFSTADLGSHFKVAAYMIQSEEGPILVEIGREVAVICELERSSLRIDAEKRP